MTRVYTLDPPNEHQIVEGVALQILDVYREGKRIKAHIRIDNGRLLWEGATDPSSTHLRRIVGKRVNEEASTVPVGAVERALMETSLSLRELLPALEKPEVTQADDAAPTTEEVDALWQKCADLALDPDLMMRIDQAFISLGVVGEQRNRKLLYLAATARLLDKPVSVFVTGPSSAGKTFLLLKVLDLLPDSAYVNYTSVSARYLAYSDDDLRHRIVMLFEADGLSEGIGAYIMRSLISENRLVVGTVEKDEAGRMTTRKVAKEGPTALFSSTTEARKVDDELLTRLLRCVVTDSPEHSRDILRGIADAHSGEPHDTIDLAPFHALQEWLSVAGEKRVSIPYARALAESVPVATVRIRRDFPQLLSLIKASAILHQRQRERIPDESIVASNRDYAIVRDLLADAFATAQQEGLTVDQREAVTAVAVLHENRSPDSGISLKEVADYLKRDKSATSRRLTNPLRAGYVQNLNAGLKGRKAAYILDDPMPDAATALPDPTDLYEEGML